MTDETLTPIDAASTESVPEAIEQTEQPVETEIAADELAALRTQAEELKALQEKLAEEKLRTDVLAQAKASGITGMEDIYDFLDKSLLTPEKLPEILSTINGKFKSRPVPIGVPMNTSGESRERSADQMLAEAAAKARASGRHEDMAAYTQLKRQLKK
ncbi:hypothetical protein ACH0B6_18380 [Solibacillus silvestris]